MPTDLDCVIEEPDYAGCPDWYGYDAPTRERATALAWTTLRILTAGMVGNCPVTIRPCLSPPCNVCAAWSGGMIPVNVNGRWYNSICGSSGCSCPAPPQIVLPGSVGDVSDVYVDGVALDHDSYRVDNGRLLVRTDGEPWPCCQDMSRDYLGDVGTLAVIYTPGIPVTAQARYAAGVLSCEYAKACTGSKCRLPSSVTSISRQGVTMEFSEGLFSNGLTGIREVDLFILSVNPHHIVVPPRVWSPDMPCDRFEQTQKVNG